MENPGKLIMLIGAALVAVGALVYLWLWLFPKFGPGNLPLDLKYESSNVKFYFPLGTCLLISVLLTGLMYLLGKFRR